MGALYTDPWAPGRLPTGDIVDMELCHVAYTRSTSPSPRKGEGGARVAGALVKR